jgi:glycosyltransferase involved in cell wall biosynthesis
MIKVLQISTSDIGGGAERIALTLHNELNARGHDAGLAVGRKYSESEKISEISHFDAQDSLARRALRIPNWMAKRKIKGARHVKNLLTRVCEPEKWANHKLGLEDFEYPGTRHLHKSARSVPDIYHAHNLHGDYFDLRQLPNLSRQAPLILTMHDAWLLSGHCAHSFDCERWKTGCGQCPYLDAPPAVAADNTSLNWFHKKTIYSASKLYVTCVSKFLLDKLDRSMLKPRMAKVIYNGVDTQLFRPAKDPKEIRRKWQFPVDAKIVVFSSVGGRKNPWKDFATFESTFQSISENYVGKEKLIFLCLGGTGTTRKNGNCRLVFTGFLPNQAMVAELYQMADLYLHPTKIDSFPNVILEAMACGIPSIATAVGGIPEQINDGWNGFLCKPGNAQELTIKALKLLDDPGMRGQMGKNGMNLVREMFTLDHQLDAYLDFYREVLEDFHSVGQSVVRNPIHQSG